MGIDDLSDGAKWEAFKMTMTDDVESLRQALSRHEPEVWSVGVTSRVRLCTRSPRRRA